MATFVLVHGGWEAGWVWRDVAAHLRAAGHDVHCPTLTGLGERAHLLSRAIDLDTHINDIIGVLRWERLANVTLVGHSYGGMVVTGVADRAPAQVGAVIYLDAFVPKHGQSIMELVAPERSAAMRKLVENQGEGWYMPVAALPIQGITDARELAVLKEFCVPHPFATMTQGVKLSGGNGTRAAKKSYVFATGYAPTSFGGFAAEAKALGWPVEQLATHHFTMLSMPRETAAVLMRHAA